MVRRDELVSYLDELLNIEAVPGDKSSNGLQVEGKGEVRRIIGAVDACAATYEQTIEEDGDFIFVHHGEFWSSLSSLTGRVGQRFRLLFQHDLSLYAAHLPLDAHPTLSHNACMARLFEIEEATPFAEYAGAHVGLWAELPTPLSLAQIQETLNDGLSTSCQLVTPHDKPISRLAIVSGGGSSALPECQALGIECLVTGEVGHTDFHIVHELGIPLIAAGHYKTECPGVEAVLLHLAEQFDVACEFIDIPTGL